MATNSSSRDARRRRIAERGSDRLALITGRLDSLPSSKSFSDLPPTVVPQNEDKHSSSFSHDFSNDPSQHDKYGGRTGIEQHSVQSDSSSQESRPSALDTDEKIKQSPVSSKIEGSPISTSNVEHHSANIEPVIHRRFNSISPRQITVAVAASEMIRIYCSLAAAILVFLSYIGFPIVGNSIIKSVILSRPLYLLLVTNISVVLVPLLLDKQRQVNSCAEASGASPLGAFQFGKALEVGLMLQQVFGGLFMDCSVYSVVVVCLLSLAQKLGYGDIHAVNPREMIFVMIYVSFDMVLGAYLIGNITALIVKGSKTERYRDKMSDIFKYLSRNKLGKDIRTLIKDHLRLQYECSYTDSTVLQDLPISIRAKISQNLYKPYVENLLFKECSAEFISQIVNKLCEEFFSPGELIMEQGDAVDQIYIVCHGVLVLHTDAGATF